jgi:hypothetical protein
MRANRRKLGSWLLLTTLAASPGCLTLSPQALELPPECVQACHSLPCCCRGRVFVFLIDGFDPLDGCGVARVRQSLIDLGFIKVYDGHFYHAGWFADEMRRLHAEEPDAHFVVAGFSTGAETARSLAESVAGDGITVDLLAVVDGPLWAAAVPAKPENVVRVLHLPGCAAAGQPLADELTAIAGLVPVPMPPVIVVGPELPTPRPVEPPPAAPRDAWDFLKPATRLDPPATELPMTREHTPLREKYLPTP